MYLKIFNKILLTKDWLACLALEKTYGDYNSKDDRELEGISCFTKSCIPLKIYNRPVLAARLRWQSASKSSQMSFMSSMYPLVSS